MGSVPSSTMCGASRCWATMETWRDSGRFSGRCPRTKWPLSRWRTGRGSGSIEPVEKAMELPLPLTPNPAPPARALAMSQQEMAEYAGRYTAPRRAPIELLVDRGRLLLHGAQPMVVVKIGELRFRAVSAGEGRSATIPEADPSGGTAPEFLLLRDSLGQIRYLHMQARAMRREDRAGRA